MEIERTVTVNAPADQLWDMLARRFHDVGSWASMIDTSEALERQSGDAGVADRMCITPQGIFKEKVTSFDESKRTFAYIAYEGLPGFVREGGNTWWVKDLGNRRSEVRFRMKFDLHPVASVLMGWMLKRQMGRAADDVAADLKTFAETGRVSKAKVASAAKYAQKRAA